MSHSSFTAIEQVYSFFYYDIVLSVHVYYILRPIYVLALEDHGHSFRSLYLFIYRANKEEKIHADMTYSDSSVVKRL